jgi:hypothetical protein
MGRKLWATSRTIRRRSGEAKAEVLKLTAETGELLERSIKQTGRLATVARRQARGRSAKATLTAAARQSPQAPLRPGSIPPEGRPGPVDLD